MAQPDFWQRPQIKPMQKSRAMGSQAKPDLSIACLAERVVCMPFRCKKHNDNTAYDY